jgi:dihydropteroate synthase
VPRSWRCSDRASAARNPRSGCDKQLASLGHVPGSPRLIVADLPRRALMGVVNVTPDSFSDGGRYFDAPVAIAHGLALAEAGAAVLDVGGESTRPGAEPVDADEELRRVLPVVRALVADAGVPVSIDTTKAAVARSALEAGVSMVNDVSGGTSDGEMLSVVADADAAFVAMHMRGTPRTMQEQAHYRDVVREVGDALRTRVASAVAAGIDARSILADPGVGFAKNAVHNVELLRRLPELAPIVGAPLLVGASRKSFLGRLLGDLDHGAGTREDATLAVTVWSFVHGAAVVRVHDVERSRRAVDLLRVMDRATEDGLAA